MLCSSLRKAHPVHPLAWLPTTLVALCAPAWMCAPAVLFSSLREECERMGVNERVLISDEAGRQFYVPALESDAK